MKSITRDLYTPVVNSRFPPGLGGGDSWREGGGEGQG